MSEEKPDVQELLKRIDQLLDILNLVSRDLREVVTTLKTVKPTPTPAPAVAPTPTPPLEGMRDVEDVKVMFPKNLENLLSFEVKEKFIIIKPRQYLGSGNFAKIASIIRDAGGEYISAGKDSHFRIPKQVK
ncbi:MAG: hypothetical protein U9O89_04745 [Thermoproteota archaeon]|nr:hypothetical protein [Thermoproteota archaeon]